VLPAAEDKFVDESRSDAEFVEASNDDEADEVSDWALVAFPDPFIDMFLFLLL
jgi:hypothetical protein